MRDAEFIKSVTVAAPAEDDSSEGVDYVTLELYLDTETGNFFALDSEYLLERPNHVIFSPFAKGLQLRLP